MPDTDAQHIQVVSVEPAERFQGLDQLGMLIYPNRYVCPHCGYGVAFKETDFRRHAGLPFPVNLPPELAASFVPAVEVFLEAYRAEGIILDFACPRCGAPVAIGFDWQEVHMAHLRSRPAMILEAVTWPATAS
ncbi:MAG: hypothetical protein M3069_27465 [Chloroflexota bacterium]|nr:hypothetical protein [Chloroflexota bacterium]